VIALSLKDVSKRRGHGHRAVQVLEGATLEVQPGELVLLEGPSGSGKTTLLGVAGGLLSPDRGEVALAGRALHRETAEGRRAIRSRQVGLVFQRSNLLAGLTARDNIVLMSRIAGMSPGDGAREAARLLDELELSTCADRYPEELSGGEEQRVAVARALIHRPSVVLADEPTGNLDWRTGRAVAAALSKLALERQSAVLVCTHDARLVPFSTRRLQIRDGRVLAAAE
jgi:putative ABC transport system ATP-binding protein